MNQTLRVLHVLNELRPSGAETMLRIAAPLFREQGVECEVLTTGKEAGPYAGALEAAGYRIHHMPYSRSPFFFLKVARFARQSGYDLVHLHSERGFFPYVVAAWLAGGRKLVRTVHNNFNFSGFLRFRRGLERRLAERLGVRFVTIAPGVDQTERRLYGTSPTLIPNWFDGVRFQPATPDARAQARTSLGIREDEYVMVTVGNCSQTKNHTVLIEALATCTESSWCYLHVGLEEQGEPERALAERLGIADRIRFIGAVDDVRPILNAADLYVMPSLFEGFSIATLEALGMGLPALLTDVPGLADIRQYLDGIAYCEPNAESVAAALRPLLEKGPGLDEHSASRSAVVHRTFGAERGVRDYCALYVEACGAAGHVPEQGMPWLIEPPARAKSGVRRDEVH